MQIPGWRNVLSMKNSLTSTFLPLKTAATASATTTYTAFFHSTPSTCEKWKSQWTYEVKKNQQPSKNYIRYSTRQKRADTKRALQDLLFYGGFSKTVSKDEDPFHKLDRTEDWDSDRSRKKKRSKLSAPRAEKAHNKKIKRRLRRDSFYKDYDYPEKEFQATFGNRWYTWSFRGESLSQSSASGFHWRENPYWTNHRRNQWGAAGEPEDESYAVGSSSDRMILGLPPTGALKIEDVKNAFRLSALKWHPDKHQGPSQAVAEEKFKLCVNAYKSLCNAFS